MTSTPTPTPVPSPVKEWIVNQTFNGSSDYADITSDLSAISGLTIGSIYARFKTNGTGIHAIFAASDQGDSSSEFRLFIEGSGSDGEARYGIREGGTQVSFSP